MNPILEKFRRIRYPRLVAFVLVAFAVLACLLLLSDVKTAFEYNLSFAILTAGQTYFVSFLVYVACGLAAILSGASAILDRSKRIVSIILLAVSLALIPATILYARHIEETTLPAILQR
jgi:uncharacterized membrane protein